MELSQAVGLIQKGVSTKLETWADLGAGTGLFTLALEQLLAKGSTVYALDKSPHALYKLPSSSAVKRVIVEGDFTKQLNLPVQDGLLMANALHYVSDKETTLKEILNYLKPGGTFILVEYELESPVNPWIPYPITFRQFEKLAGELSLSPPVELGRIPSAYGHQYIYAAKTVKGRRSGSSLG